MNTKKLKTIQNTFIYRLTDEQVLMNTFNDKTLEIATDIINGIDDIGVLKYKKQLIQRDHKKRCFIIDIILKERVKLNGLNDFLKLVIGKYENASVEKYDELNDGKCNCKLIIYDNIRKTAPIFIFNIVHPFIQQYNLIHSLSTYI